MKWTNTFDAIAKTYTDGFNVNSVVDVVLPDASRSQRVSAREAARRWAESRDWSVGLVPATPRAVLFVAPPGTPAAEAMLPAGSRGAMPSSLRSIAAVIGVSHTTVARDLACVTSVPQARFSAGGER